MAYIALTNFSYNTGKNYIISMHRGEVRELTDETVISNLTAAGHIKEYTDAAQELEKVKQELEETRERARQAELKFNGMIERTITSVKSDTYAGISNSTFRFCHALESAEFPNAGYIADYAFEGCRSLETIFAPNASEIGYRAFGYDNKLRVVEFPRCERIGQYAFGDTEYIVIANFPKLTEIGTGLFPSGVTKVCIGQRATTENADVVGNNVLVFVKPEDLEWYSTDENWAAIYARGNIRSIEDLPKNVSDEYREIAERIRGEYMQGV